MDFHVVFCKNVFTTVFLSLVVILGYTWLKIDPGNHFQREKLTVRSLATTVVQFYFGQLSPTHSLRHRICSSPLLQS